MESKEKEMWKKSGEIASQIMAKAIQLAKPETPLLEIAEKMEAEAEKLKVKWAFPVNLSINEIAAHYTPSHEDKTKANGLLKIDLGISIDGYISDIARSVDLTPENKYKELVKASEDALKEAVKTSKYNIEIRHIGKAIHDSITKKGFSRAYSKIESAVSGPIPFTCKSSFLIGSFFSRFNRGIRPRYRSNKNLINSLMRRALTLK